MRAKNVLMVALAFLIPLQMSSIYGRCPFCTAVSQTFTQEMEQVDIVAIGIMIEPPPPLDETRVFDPEAESFAIFKIQKTLQGRTLYDETKPVKIPYFGEGKKGEIFLIMATEPLNLLWHPPLRINERVAEYLPKLEKLPKEGADRLAFFQEYLEDSDELLRADAYDEFANADYAAVIALKPKMHHDQLVSWINDPQIPAARHRLYLTMLGVCGNDDDVIMLEKLIRSGSEESKAALDSMVACYLTLGGPESLDLIDDLFFENKDSPHSETYSAIMALRFHGTEADVIPRERLIVSLRYLLDRPSLADLVIPDLARWEDWESVDKMVQLFKDSDESTSWVRVPIINYLRACPLPEADTHIVALEKIDPEAVRRANTFFLFSGGGRIQGTVDADKTGADKEGSDKKEIKQ
ncbi:MAG: hypothetical protein MPJ24_11135 [Pirellulaceae bacterium]|nr:hypothetical protein [Pirellulaceae bacterium]